LTADLRVLPAELAARLCATERWVVLTGAGISADSGVPTFRDAQTGLWARFDPVQLATPEAFRDDPELVWAWYAWRRKLIAAASPNPGHRALAELAALKPQLRLVTQNVDGLHQRAGSRDVIEIHGNITRDRCSSCGRIAAGDTLAAPRPPRCVHCSHRVRPDVVWFGEPLPADALAAAYSAAAACEVFVAIGTSGVVYPAAGLADVAARAGATIIEINPARTPLSAAADHVLDGTAAAWLPTIAEHLKRTIS